MLLTNQTYNPLNFKSCPTSDPSWKIPFPCHFPLEHLHNNLLFRLFPNFLFWVLFLVIKHQLPSTPIFHNSIFLTIRIRLCLGQKDDWIFLMRWPRHVSSARWFKKIFLKAPDYLSATHNFQTSLFGCSVHIDMKQPCLNGFVCFQTSNFSEY